MLFALVFAQVMVGAGRKPRTWQPHWKGDVLAVNPLLFHIPLPHGIMLSLQKPLTGSRLGKHPACLPGAPAGSVPPAEQGSL